MDVNGERTTRKRYQSPFIFDIGKTGLCICLRGFQYSKGLRAIRNGCDNVYNLVLTIDTCLFTGDQSQFKISALVY